MKMKLQKKNSGAFTLIELLAVIAIIGVLAGFIIGGLGAVKKRQNISAATAELKYIEDALESYKLKYGSYPPANLKTPNNPMLPPLYYELSGVTLAGLYTTLDGAAKIPLTGGNSLLSVFGLAGAVNLTHGGGEDIKNAENFLTGIKSTMVGYYSENPFQVIPPTGPAAIAVPRILITSVRGPDVNWKPLGFQDQNPFQYNYPGTNNPNGYDLWVELHIGGKTNIVGNWTAK
jgi:prepilin-type N-terminal cleavage/methylation domain-containing protein